MKTGRLVTVPIDCQVNYTVKVQKSMKHIARILICHQWFNHNVMKWREYFLYWNKKKYDFIQQLGTLTSPQRQRSAILEIIPWMQNAYTLLYQPRHRDVSSSLIYALIWTQTALWPSWQCAFCLAVNGTVTCLPVFIQNILNCAPRTNEAVTGLERHGGKW